MLWSLPLLPMLAAALLPLLPGRRALMTATACGALAATLGLAVAAAAGGWTGMYPWSDLLRLEAALTPVSAMMAVLVPAIALPVTLYAGAGEQGLARLLALLVFFVGAMELLVIAADLLTLLIAWELVGACSWALIAHHWTEPGNARAARYAFLATRCGDLGLYLAAATAFAALGTFAYADLGRLEGAARHLLVFGVVLSATAKSAQVPFSPWLFRAMAGPTPASALLHAAAMVAAGAYLLIRLEPVLAGAAWFGPAVAAIGAATALAGGLVALLQSHAKKLLAASTSAHYGLMFVAVGAGFPGAAALHLAAHAGFKALLFLAAGTAVERAGSEALARMRLGRVLPVTAGLSAIGGAALAGVPPLGAAWTKEAVTAAAGHLDPWLVGATLIASALSAAYAMRFQRLAYGSGARPASGSDGCSGSRYGAGGTIRSLLPGDGARIGALGLLAAATLALSVLWWPGADSAAFHWLAAQPVHATSGEKLASVLAVAIGLWGGWLLAGRHAWIAATPRAAALADWAGLPALIDRTVSRPLAALARSLARLDEEVLDAVPRGAARLGSAEMAARLDDRYPDGLVRVVAAFGRELAAAGAGPGEQAADGLPRAAARLVVLGSHVRRLQTGLSHHYFALICAGAVALLMIILLAARFPCCP